MKNLTTFLLSILILLVVSSAKSEAQIGFGLFGGLSTPNAEMNNVYNTENISGASDVYNLFRDGAKSGYHIGAKLRLPLAAGIMLTGGISWNRFPESEIVIKNPDNSVIGTFKTVQDIIPISAGLNYYILTTGIGIYGLGELQYNYNKNTVNFETGSVSVPLNFDSAPTYNRVGAALGAGIDINAIIFLGNVELKYNFSNIIGREDGEELKSYLTLSLGIYLGSSGAR